MTEDNRSFNFTSVKLGQDDIAWADSCLSQDLDISDGGWSSLRDALLETLDATNYSSSYERENSPQDDLMDILYSSKTVNMHKAEEKTVNSFAASSEEADRVKYAIFETFNSKGPEPNSRDKSPSTSTSEGPEPNSDDRFNNENTEDFWSKHRVEDIFLPTYDESLRGLGISDPEVDFVFQEFPLKQSTEDIFKTWDFDIPLEENDLMKQLNKALAENSTEPIPPVSVHEELEILEDEPIDDLVSRIAELALSPKSY